MKLQIETLDCRFVIGEGDTYKETKKITSAAKYSRTAAR